MQIERAEYRKLSEAERKQTMSDQLVVRIDNGDGSKQLCDWSRAERQIREHYDQADIVLRQLSLGHPVRCPFATYQHRDFVAGFEREATT